MCPPPTIDVALAGSRPFSTAFIESGSASPVIKGSYRRHGVWHHFIYQANDGYSCFMRYYTSLGLTDLDVVQEPAHWPGNVIDIDMDPALNPAFSRVGRIQVIVEYMRRGVKHWFEFDDSIGSPRLQSYIESIGLSVFDVKIVVLTVPDSEVDLLDRV